MYAIAGMGRFSEKATRFEDASHEGEAADRACVLFNKYKLQKIAVISLSGKVVFSIKRKCSCKNVQEYMDGSSKCEDCGLVYDEAKASEIKLEEVCV